MHMCSHELPRVLVHGGCSSVRVGSSGCFGVQILLVVTNELSQAYFTYTQVSTILTLPGLTLGLGGLCSKLAVLYYAPMLIKTTIMLQPQAYCAHTMLINIINLLHPAPMHAFIRVTSW